MPAVEDRNRKKIDKSDAYRNESCQSEKVQETLRGRSLGNACYADRAAQLARVGAAADDAPHVGECCIDDLPGLNAGGAHSLYRVQPNHDHRAGIDSR